MVRAREKTIEDYMERLERHLLKKYPALEFDVVKWSEREAAVYYRPYSEEDDFAIIHRASTVTTDALVDSGFSIHVGPAD
jgi:hypothetical protein